MKSIYINSKTRAATDGPPQQLMANQLVTRHLHEKRKLTHQR